MCDQLGDFDRLQFISITFAYALNFHENVLEQIWKVIFQNKNKQQLCL